jgi:hypothetical protein
MADPLEQVLRLVAEGRLSAAEAAPILDALADERPRSQTSGERPPAPDADATTGDRARAGAPPSAIRIQVTESGRQIVNLRIPVSLGRMALDRIPGLSVSTADLVRQALAENRLGTLLAVDEGQDGVRISLE